MNKKGFTLIELLAVIIILAILMIIAVPAILNTVTAMRKNVYITQTKSIFKGAEQQFVVDSMRGIRTQCYDKTNLNMNSISSTVSFNVVMNPIGKPILIKVTDSGTKFTSEGTTLDNIRIIDYDSAELNCGILSNTLEEVSLNVINGSVKSSSLNPQTVSLGSTATFNVEPKNSDYGYSNIICNSGTPSFSNNVVTISGIIENTKCTLTYLPQYNVTLSVTHGNAVTESSKVTQGHTGLLEAEPDDDYIFDSVTCDGEHGQVMYQNGEVTVLDVQSDVSCSLSYKKVSYEVTITNPNGSLEKSTFNIARGGSDETTFSANSGYTLEEASVTCDPGIEVNISGTTITLSNVLSEGSCEITLKRLYTVTTTVSEGGSITNTQATQTGIISGHNATVITSAETNYAYSAYTCTGTAEKTVDNGVITLSNIQSNITCSVTYQLVSYRVTLSVTDGTGSNSYMITHGQTATFEGVAGNTYYTNQGTLNCDGTHGTPTITNGVVTVPNVRSEVNCTITYTRTVYSVQVNMVVGTNTKSTAKGVSNGDAVVFTERNGTPEYNVYNNDFNCRGTYTSATYDNGTVIITGVQSSVLCSMRFVGTGPTYVAASGIDSHSGLAPTYIGIVYIDPKDTTGTCNSTSTLTNTNAGCKKFYVYADNGNSYTMIMDRNMTPNVAWNSTSSECNHVEMREVATALASDTNGWAGINNSPRLITANEVATIVNFSGWDSAYQGSGGWFYFGSPQYQSKYYSSQSDSEKTKQKSYHWLFDYLSSCTNYGCETTIGSNDPWTAGYWTSDPVASCFDFDRAWNVMQSGSLSNGNPGVRWTGAGVRPVIELPKSMFQ